MKKIILLLCWFSLNAIALEIYPLVSGKISFIQPVGASIKPGDVLVKIDDTQAQLELERLLALQAIHQQNFDDKRLELEQTQQLYDRLVNSYRDLELAQLDFDRAKQTLEAHRVEVKIAEHKLSEYQIISPVKGAVKATPNVRNVANINAPKILMVIE